jgi:hypothetical protein
VIAPFAALLAVATLLSSTAAPAGDAVLFRFADPRITEASGIAAGRLSPGVFYVQNDSGDSARFFAIDRRTGATVATVTVAGARNVDWEDIAVGPNAAGTPSVWLADIGDNDAVRHTVQLYRVVEPRLDPQYRNRTVRLPVAEKWRLRYPGGPVDAESLAVAPDGTPYLVTKSFGGATVYRVPDTARPDQVQRVRRVAQLALHETGTGNPFGLAGQLTATGAAISADGEYFAIRTYADAWVWRQDAPPDLALGADPVVVPLPSQPQGEGIAIVGGRLVIDSEGAHTRVYSIRLPAELRGPAPAPTGSPSPDNGTAGPTGPAASAGPHIGSRVWLYLIGGAALLVLAGGAVRNRRGRPGR